MLSSVFPKKNPTAHSKGFAIGAPRARPVLPSVAHQPNRYVQVGQRHHFSGILLGTADDQPKDTLILGLFEYLIKSGFQVGHGQVFFFGLHRVTPGLVGASLVRPLILYPHQLL